MYNFLKFHFFLGIIYFNPLSIQKQSLNNESFKTSLFLASLNHYQLQRLKESVQHWHVSSFHRKHLSSAFL